uniref:MMS19 nucleotide excision repair protein n=1 Tax=Knipowitschia caucasica TaxID=637954 RepID=A0AAV2LVE3_KNICA
MGVNTYIVFFKMPLDADVPEASQGPSHQSLCGRCVAALASVSRGPSVVQQSTPVLLELISAAHTGSVQFTMEDVVLACHGLQRIADQVQVSEETEETGRCFHHLIIPRLLSLALQAALQAADVPRPSPLLEESVLTAMVPVINSSCSRLQPKFAEETASKAVSLFLNGDVSFLPDNSFPSQIQLLKGDCWRQSQMVCLLMGCVCAVPRAVEVPHQDELLSALEELSLSSSHTLSYTSAAKCYAGLVNKRTPGEALDSLVQRTVKRVCSELDNPKSGVRSQAFTLMIWVAKALLLRYHPLSATLTDKLFSLLDDPDLGSEAADGFSLLMSDSSDVLNRALHADVRIMYRQRFFTDNSSKLVQGFHAATGTDTEKEQLTDAIISLVIVL